MDLAQNWSIPNGICGVVHAFFASAFAKPFQFVNFRFQEVLSVLMYGCIIAVVQCYGDVWRSSCFRDDTVDTNEFTISADRHLLQ